MNAVTSFVAMVSLLLALATAGGAAKEQAKVNPSAAMRVTPSKIALNHNETLVIDTASSAQQPSLWNQWLTRVQALFFTRPIPGGCDEWGCGTNHNETMVRDLPRELRPAAPGDESSYVNACQAGEVYR